VIHLLLHTFTLDDHEHDRTTTVKVERGQTYTTKSQSQRPARTRTRLGENHHNNKQQHQSKRKGIYNTVYRLYSSDAWCVPLCINQSNHYPAAISTRLVLFPLPPKPPPLPPEPHAVQPSSSCSHSHLGLYTTLNDIAVTNIVWCIWHTKGKGGSRCRRWGAGRGACITQHDDWIVAMQYYCNSGGLCALQL